MCKTSPVSDSEDKAKHWWTDIDATGDRLEFEWSGVAQRDHHVGPGLQFPEWLTVKGNVEGFQVWLSVAPQGDTLGVEELRVRQCPGGPPVTVEAIRNLPLARLVRGVGWEFLKARVEDPDTGRVRAFDHPAMKSETYCKELVAEGPTDRTLSAVAYLYRIANAVGDAPVKFIEETLELSRSKTSRWIAMAREKGTLGPAEGPGRAGG